MLTVGRFGDLYGRKRPFAMGLVLFMAASLFAGASVNPAMLIGSRLVQGLGAAMVLPSTLSTLNAMFQGLERGIAFAIWGSTIGGMAAVGPLVGGWLATDVSWRWAFWLNIRSGCSRSSASRGTSTRPATRRCAVAPTSPACSCRASAWPGSCSA